MLTFFWFRRDLRLTDNAGLYRALKSGKPVQPVFIFDRLILDALTDQKDARVTFIFDAVAALKKELQVLGSDLMVFYGNPIEIWQKLLTAYSADAVFTNTDYEQYAVERDAAVQAIAAKENSAFHAFKDQVILDGGEVLKDDETPYTVFTPYSKKWRERILIRLEWAGDTAVSFYLKPYPTEKYLSNLAKPDEVRQALKTADATPDFSLPSLESMGFKRSDLYIPPKTVARSLIKQYKDNRNYPSVEGVSRLGIHFRFGTVSIREKALAAQSLSETYLSELIWRDFYSMILQRFPYVEKGPFRKNYDHIQWRDSDEDFEKWKTGHTGYPIVDAGMRQLNATGFMHNRVRMITASFLAKHLLLNWRLGEAYFAEKLLDYDLASNNGGWQWAVGCGTDAAPYFRIFNPILQQKTFDPDFKYIRAWVSEFGTDTYPPPMVDHKFARERCLRVYREGLQDR